MIKSIALKNFQLFKSQQVDLGRLNIIIGKNCDDISESGNGSGKSTILNAIRFALYGEAGNLTIKDLVSIGESKSEVEVIIEDNNQIIKIVRRIPSELEIEVDNVALQMNTATLKQQWINDRFGTLNFFKTYRNIDTSKGINLLDQGITSLRKSLMEFVDDQFSKIRTSLLAKKNEREIYNVSKKLYHHYLSENRKTILENAQTSLTASYSELSRNITALNSKISTAKGNIHTTNYKITNNREVAEGSRKKICPTCKTVLGTEKIAAIKARSEDEINSLKIELDRYQTELKDYQSELNYLTETKDNEEKKRSRISDRLMKLNQAFKFAEYKYTKADVDLYAETIKVLDSFSGYYINQWLASLALVINDLLKDVNLEVTFSSDKSFLTIKNENYELKYDQLSSGQKTFLNAIFKIGILLNQGEMNGLLLIDEGINTLDHTNLNKFIDILKRLNYQTLLVYQNIQEMTDVNIINVERKNGESHVS